MTQKQINKIIKLLKSKGVTFEKGLSDAELKRIRNTFDIAFPADLELFLTSLLPTSKGFVQWRKWQSVGLSTRKEQQEIEARLNWPLEGMLFDIRNNTFWLEEWGEKPISFEEQKEIAVAEFQNYPKLIPIYSHRYMPQEPNEIGNPVFSVYQMDIIDYGLDLADYFANEFNFNLPNSFGSTPEPRIIKFWSDVIG